ncbi:unnamed protein product [Rhizophagus irregularis]|nr:unnamed protein product [Rhizophagus irregularis]
MEYNDSETTETSNSESSSFNSEYEENETSKKIAELKQEIAKLENTNKIKQKKTKKLLTLNQPKISEAKSTDSKLAMKIKKGSNEPEQPISKGKYKHQNISSYLHIPKEFGMEFMRLLVAEKLYPLCPTTEYHDMPLSEINKCIDRTLKSRKPNGNSKRFKRKVVESNDEINEEEQQTSGSILSTKNCGNF